jgi:glutamyl-tRNA synthetase
MVYKDMGYLPEALLNYLVRLGWSHGDQEIFSRDELISSFNLENIGKSAGVFDPEKLLWLNSHYIKERSPESLVSLLEPFVEDRESFAKKAPDYLAKAVHTLQPRSHTLVELGKAMGFYLADEIVWDPAAARKFLSPEMLEPFKRLFAAMEELEVFNEENLEKTFRRIIVDELGLKLGKAAQPVRVALTGVTMSPGLFEIIDVLGRETVLKRLGRALAHIERQAAGAAAK